MKPVQTVQEEDACSCRFPEEEEGEYELWSGDPQSCWDSLEKKKRENKSDAAIISF